MLLGQADEEYQSDFIGGFLPIIHSYGYDAAVFSMLYKYQETYEQEQGDFSVFKLIPYNTIDGIVVLCDTIQTSSGINNLMKEIKENYDGPVLCIDGNFDYPTQYSKSSKSIHALVKHLVNEHGYTDIAFLNGRKEHPFSKERFWDYMSGLKEVGIDYEEKRVFYGDFWYSSGENMVENLLRSKEILPQAILCANDCMAIGVCKALESRGYKIPRDVAVVSYDCTEEGRQSPVPVTSAYIQADHAGRLAASNINRLVYGKNIIQDEPEPKLFVGESCGCHNERSRFADIRRKIWDTQKSRLGFESPYNNMMDDLLEQETPFDYINTVYSYLHQLGEYNRFFLCINEDMISGKSAGRCKEFSEKMTAVIDSGSETKTDSVGFKESFPRSELLPEDAWDKEKTQTFFFTPICHKTDLFGYAAISYKNPDLSYDGIYRMWIKLVSRSMDLLRRNEMYRASEEKQATSAAAVTETTPVSYEDEIMTEAVSEILDKLNIGVRSALNQKANASPESQEDGMDITLCLINKTTKTVQVAAANHVIYCVHDGLIETIEGDMASVGGSMNTENNYSNHQFSYTPGTRLYMFSDGYQDQFGGEDNKKFLGVHFKKLLFETSTLPMEQQCEKLDTTFENWKGQRKQIDDVLVLGLELD